MELDRCLEGSQELRFSIYAICINYHQFGNPAHLKLPEDEPLNHGARSSSHRNLKSSGSLARLRPATEEDTFRLRACHLDSRARSCAAIGENCPTELL